MIEQEEDAQQKKEMQLRNQIQNLEESQKNKDYYRWLILLLGSFCGLGVYMISDFPGILQIELIKYFEITSIEYQLMYSVAILPNIILPLFMGVIIDKITPKTAMLSQSILLALSQILCTYGVYIKSYNTLLLGRFMFGITSNAVMIAQTVIMTKWFELYELGLGLGFIVTVGRSGTSVSSVLYPFLYNQTGQLFYPLFIGSLICLLCILFSGILYYYDQNFSKHDEISSLKNKLELVQNNQLNNSQQKDKQSFKEYTLYIYNKTGKLFWLGCFLVSLAYGVYFPFMMNLQTIINTVYKINGEEAGYLYAIPFLIGAIFIPLVGYLTDRFGNRPLVIILSTLSLLLALITIYHQHICENVCFASALGPIILIGVFYALLAGTIWVCLPMSVPQEVMGVTQGIVAGLLNLFTCIVPLFVGYIIDHAKDNNWYMLVMLIFIIMTVVVLIFGILIYYYDTMNYNILNQPKINTQILKKECQNNIKYQKLTQQEDEIQNNNQQ